MYIVSPCIDCSCDDCKNSNPCAECCQGYEVEED